MDEITAKAVRGIDEAIASHEVEIARLRVARREAAGRGTTHKARPAVAPALRSARAAGPGAIAAVATILAGIGRTTQAEITKASGKNSGTVSHALAALEADGKARRTGRVVAGSPEWASVGARARAASKPGITQAA